MKWKLASVALAVALCMVILLGALFWRLESRFAIRHADSASVVTQVKQLRDLATVRFSVQRVVGLTEPKVPVGSESILLIVQGEVVAGVDLAALRPEDAQFQKKDTVYIRLPASKILDAYLNEQQTKVWDRRITWWTPWVPYDQDLERKARLSGLEEVKKAALAGGILNQATSNAERAIREVLAAFGLHASFPDQAT
jgi:hypothetical protein